MKQGNDKPDVLFPCLMLRENSNFVNYFLYGMRPIEEAIDINADTAKDHSTGDTDDKTDFESTVFVLEYDIVLTLC